MKLCITGGGTGGHLMIAESLLEAAIKENHEVIFIGSTSGQDRKYFEHNSQFSSVYFLETTGVVNQRGFGKIKALMKIIQAIFQARKILKLHNIQATYSVGGFSAAPAAIATLSRFIPLFIHEQNAVEGRLNFLLKPYAAQFISAYDKNSKVQGYPVKEIYSKTSRIRGKIKTIIFLGGSQGAVAINNLALSVAKELNEKGFQIIHQAGEKNYEAVKAEYEQLGIKVELYGFTKDLPSLIEKADLAVSRSGASTLWELCANGLPAFFIPYPHAAADHQYHNAKFVVENALGWCYRENEDLKLHFLKLLDEDLTQKSTKLLNYGNTNVAQKMIHSLEEYIR